MESEQVIQRRSGTAALVGRPNVGKSTFLNSALEQQLAIVTPTAQTTRHQILGVVRRGDHQIALLDTPGIHDAKNRLGRRMNSVAHDAAKTADVIIFMTSLKKGAEAPTGLLPSDARLLAAIDRPERCVIVINKVDLLADKAAILPLLQSIAQAGSFAAIVPICARRKADVLRVLDEVGKLLPEQAPIYDEDFLTDRPLRFFASEYVREQVLLSTRQEVPHHVAVQIDRFEEAEEEAWIEASIHCTRKGQQGILIGAGGQKLKSIGMSARERIEELMEKKVHLRLQVVTDPDWNDSEQALAELGLTKTDMGESST